MVDFCLMAIYFPLLLLTLDFELQESLKPICVRIYLKKPLFQLRTDMALAHALSNLLKPLLVLRRILEFSILEMGWVVFHIFAPPFYERTHLTDRYFS